MRQRLREVVALLGAVTLAGLLAGRALALPSPSGGPAQPAVSIALGPGSAVYLDGEPAGARQLSPGMRVHLEYDLDGNDRIARRVTATSGSPPPRR